MNVTRYGFGYEQEFDPQDDGDYVLFSDYEALAQQCAELRKIIATTAKSLADTTVRMGEQVLMLASIEDARRGMK